MDTSASANRIDSSTRDDRRQNSRHDVAVRVTAKHGDRVIECNANDLSPSGVGLNLGPWHGMRAGDAVDLKLHLPGIERPVEVQGKIRWTNTKRRRCGVEFSGFRTQLGATLTAAFLALIPVQTLAKAEIPSFDPDNTKLDLNRYPGSERPDPNEIMRAFEAQFDDFDRCVASVKTENSQRILGEAQIQVLLNPSGARPLGINQKLPRELSRSKKGKRLAPCLRDAVAEAKYPRYDGPPLVVDFEFEIDPGYVETE